MNKRNCLSAVLMSALFLSISVVCAFTDDVVVPATNEDIRTFENAVMEKNRNQYQAEKGSVQGLANQEQNRIRTEQHKMVEVVSKETKKVILLDSAQREKMVKQSREQSRLRESTQEQTKTQQREGWSNVRDMTTQSGKRKGKTEDGYGVVGMSVTVPPTDSKNGK